MKSDGTAWQAGHKALRKGRASIAGEIYLLTATMHNRAPLFSDFRLICTVAQCFETKLALGNNRLLAWVLMPDHAHWLLQLGSGERLETSVGRLKAISSRRLNRFYDRRGLSGHQPSTITPCVAKTSCYQRHGT